MSGEPFLPGQAVAPALPRGPVLGWSNWRWVRAAPAHSVEEHRHTALTTSGRAAIYQALQQLKLPPGRGVLVPTYHCPTMVAPVHLAGLQPEYFALRNDGLPDLERISAASAARCAAIIVPHYFGLPRSLAEVRRWCDSRGIAMIEDCAHCYFGQAGDRPVGAWGDYAIASVSKFFPVSEAGLLASAHTPIKPLRLEPAGLMAQIKGVADVFEMSSRHGRLRGLGGLLGLLFGFKNRIQSRVAAGAGDSREAADFGNAAESSAAAMLGCDMTRSDRKPLWASMALKSCLPRGRIRLQRQRNYAAYLRRFQGVAGVEPLMPHAATSAVPYVFPLWVDDPSVADALYAALRQQKMPVFRWDRLWPGTPELPGDAGWRWSRQVLQLLCHQDLSEDDIGRASDAVLAWLRANGVSRSKSGSTELAPDAATSRAMTGITAEVP